MAKTRRYFRKSLGYRKGNRRWKNFSKYNYNHVKIDINFHIQYPTANGEPVIYFGPEVSAKAYSVASLLNDHSDWTVYKPLYQMYKLKGIRFECTPMPCNAGQEGVTQASGVYLGWCASIVGSDAYNTSWLKDTDRAIVLNPLAKTVKYWSMYGYQDDWKLVTDNLGGNISVYSDETSTLSAGPVWHVKVIMYLSCKMANK